MEDLGAGAGTAGRAGGAAAAALGAVLLVVSLSPATATAANRTCGGTLPTIVGSSEPETITGTRGIDIIRAGGGDDIVDSGGGHDVVCGGRGDDRVDAGDGDDLIRSGAGDDRGDGGEGDDSIKGQGGADEAAGGPGTDECLTERHSGCEADLATSGSGPFQVTGGDATVFAGSLSVSNSGPTPAVSAAATVYFPPEAEFVPSASDPRCGEPIIDQVFCGVGALGVRSNVTFPIGFRVPDCPPPPGITIPFSATAQDAGTTDPSVGPPPSLSVEVVPAASCASAP